MELDHLSIACSVFSEEWPDFDFKKSKKTWVKQTRDRVLLIVHCQGSRWGRIYYLNFGVYYLDIQGIVKPMSNPPKPSDWHLFSRYRAFREMSTAEHNELFSLEDGDPASLQEKCLEIASFCKNNILSRLETLGNKDLLKQQIGIRGEKAFDPFHTQQVARRDIVSWPTA